jgi:hypothetical protein
MDESTPGTRGAFGAPKSQTSTPSADKPSRQQHADGTPGGLQLLDGEEVVASILRVGTSVTSGDLTRDGLYLTNRRLLYAGTLRQLLVIPAGRATYGAFLPDVDAAGMVTFRLPVLVMLVGLAIVIGGIGAISGDQQSWGTAGIVAGGVLVLLWILVKREALTFHVSGSPIFIYAYTTRDTAASASFVNSFYTVKAITEKKTSA